MARTNMEIDDSLVGRVMERYGLKTKKEAVDFALRRAAPQITVEDIDSLRGIGWEGDLDEMRRGNDPEHKWCSA